MDSIAQPDIYDEVAYLYDGSLEGLLSAVFLSFENRQSPSDVVAQHFYIPRLLQVPIYVNTDVSKASRVRKWLYEKCGSHAYRWVMKASLSSDPNAGTAVFNFIVYAVNLSKKSQCGICENNKRCKAVDTLAQCPRLKRIMSDITHKSVEPIFRINRTIDNECEKIRQFARFQHLKNDEFDLWFAKINPKDNIVALVMDHFVERFNVQQFVIYDEVHNVAGVHNGTGWFLSIPDNTDFLKKIKFKTSDEILMQTAWKKFYRSLTVDDRYNPELRMHYMPKRFWKNLIEMQEELPSLCVSSKGKEI